MRTSILASVFAATIALFAQGCAAESNESTGDSASDVTSASVGLTTDDRATLMNALLNAGAPASTNTHGSTVITAKLELTTAQGGMAHYISESATLTGTDGTELGDLSALGVDWKSLETALVDAGLSWNTKKGVNGASSSTMDATISCERTSADAEPTCTVSAL